MSANDVIEAYVVDVMRRLPAKDRNDIGFELRELLKEMLGERAQTEGLAADDGMVLTMLRDFGTPAEVAARYRSPGLVIIPEDGTRSFALLSIAGVGLQWALTLPRVFDGEPLAVWWLTSGLGSLWWPGLLVMIALAAACIRQVRPIESAWRPRTLDPERISRRALALGLSWFAIGAVVMICLPLLVRSMPDPLPRIFAFDPDFLRRRAPLALLMWVASFAILAVAFSKGRWSPTLWRLQTALNLAWLALLSWWLATGDIFRVESTDGGAKLGIAFIMALIAMDLIYKVYRRRVRIGVPRIPG
jgi:hypothetical protein